MGSKLSHRGFLKLASLAGLGSVVIPQDLFAQYRYLAARLRAQSPCGLPQSGRRSRPG